MSIAIKIFAEGDHIIDQYKKENATRIEVATALLRLEQIKHDLLSLEFQDELFFEKREE